MLLQTVEHKRLKEAVTKHDHAKTVHAQGGKGRPRSRKQVTVSGRQILIDGQPLHIKGICWSPVHKGDGNHPDYHNYIQQDIDLMKGAGINAVRTYDAELTKDSEVMNRFAAAGIWVVPTVYGYGGADPYSAVDKVNGAKDHAAILMWAIGNEWNYNGIYVGMPHHESLARLNEVARLVKQADPSRPLATVYGNLPDVGTINAMPDVDVWGINFYNGLSFGGTMAEWSARSGKPLYIGEFGADAFNALANREDDESQARATDTLAKEILAASAVRGGPCSGGFLFEFSDEWWKDGAGSTWDHDVGGIAPGGGPYPDLTFNEEWWGIVDVDRKPRPAYYSYQAVENPNLASAP